MKNTSLAAETEQWVGLKELSLHLKFSYQKTRRMALAGEISGGHAFPSGKNTHWRFKLSHVDAALLAGENRSGK